LKANLKRKKAFTLVEVIIACFVMAIFMGAVYKIFISGSKTAGRGQWISTTVDETRNALSILQSEIKASTYPTTIFSDTFFDPCDNDDISVPQKFYLKILKDGEKIAAPSAGDLKIMSWVVCEPEKPKNTPGKIVKNSLYLEFTQKTKKGPLGRLRLKSEAFTYTTNAMTDHAKSGKLNLTPAKSGNRNKILVRDVEFIEFSVAGTIPSEKPVDFFPISVKIHTLYPKDLKVFKENSIMATPQVGIATF
jgi:prepilin-type N-terminal cleavage/methylation domain-containing protein